MFREIFLFELRLGFRKISTYIFFCLLGAFAFLGGLAASQFFDTVKADTNTFNNSALAVASVYLSVTNGIFLLLWSSILISIMGTSIQRDYQYNTHPLFFTKPVSKAGYFFGRLLGSMFVCIFIFSSLMIGYYLGTLFGMGKPVMGPYLPENYLQPFFIFILPNILFFGLLLFSVTTFLRNTMAAYIVVILLFVFQIVSSILAQNIDNRFIASVLEPGGSTALGLITEYWSPAEQNANMIPLTGALLYNRLLWLGLALLIGALSYYGFSFSQFLRPFSLFGKKKEVAHHAIPASHTLADLPKVKQIFTNAAFRNLTLQLGKSEGFKIIKSPFFIVIALLSLGLIVFATYFNDLLDQMATYPVTYKMVSNVFGLLDFFLVIFIVFYSGTIIWREKEAGLDELTGVCPAGNGVFFFSKFIGLSLAVFTLLLAGALIGMLAQLAQGFYQIDLIQYVVAILKTLAELLVFIALALAVQSFVSNKFLGFFLTLLPILILPILFSYLDWNNPLYDFNSEGSSRPYSDMNGYGDGFLQWPFYRVYWYSISAFLCLLAIVLYPRGKQTAFKARWRLSSYFNKGRYRTAIYSSLIPALLAGGFIYFQEYVLVDSKKPKEREKEIADLEKKYKRYEKLPQPRIISVSISADIYTRSLSLKSRGHYVLQNKHSAPLDIIYFDYPGGKKSSYQLKELTLAGGFKIVDDYPDYGIRIVKLNKPLQPGDTISCRFELNYAPRSFYYRGSSLVDGNGSFISNSIFPTIGYNPDSELSENTARKEYGLPPKPRLAKVNDSAALMNNYISRDADWIAFEATLSTDEGQIAIAPGYLTKQWKEEGRQYFHYKMDSPILNFYSILSAGYQVKKDKWKNVDIEIYYQKGHEYNLERMISSIKKSFDYYTENFGPYQHRQARIIEFPRYASFAQSFPNTIPYSESIGFIMKVEDDPEKIDMPFYVTAHEIAHQWWAHQVIGGNVQGKELMSETMSQYGALMVMEKEYGKESMKKFLKYEMDQYLQGRAFEPKGELPLMKCENQQYIYYNKGSIVMYALKEFLGEKNLNSAIRAYLNKTKFSGPPYTNSVEFVNHIKQVTPDSLQYLVSDLFEKITIYENYVSELEQTKLPDGSYKVKLTVGSAKYYSDSIGNRVRAGVNDYMDIGIFAVDSAKGKEKQRPLVFKRIRMDQPEKTFEFIVKEKPVMAGIDPYLILVDRTPANNTARFGKKPKKPNLDPDAEVYMFGLEIE